MKKIALICFVVLSVPFIVRPSNLTELLIPFYCEDYLLTNAIMADEKRESIVELRWPKSLIRYLANSKNFDFTKVYPEQNLSKLQFILTAYYDHKNSNSEENEKVYVLSMAKRSIDGGAKIDNLTLYGMTALHEAIVLGDANVTNMLIENKANCGITVTRPNKPIDGLNSFELAKFMVEKESSEERRKIFSILEKTECNKPDILEIHENNSV